MIYISGEIKGVYRSQNIIKTLLDDKQILVFLPFRFSCFKNRWAKKCIDLFFYFITLPVRVLVIGMSTTIIVLPMNTHKFSLFDVLIAKVFRKKIIYEYYISLYDAWVNDRKKCNPNSLKAKFSLFYDKAFTLFADKIICLNQSEINYYLRYMASGADKKIYKIPLVIDHNSKIYNSITKPTNTVSFCWWGSYISLHGLELIIESFSLSTSGAQLFIFGDSEHKSKKYMDLVNALKLEKRVHFNHEYTFNNGLLPSFIKERKSIALGIFGDSQKAKSVLPNKTVDSCLLSIPTLTAKSTATDEFFTEGQNIIYADRSSESLAIKIDRIVRGEYELDKIGEAAHDVYLSNFSPDIFKERYLKMLNQ